MTAAAFVYILFVFLFFFSTCIASLCYSVSRIFDFTSLRHLLTVFAISRNSISVMRTFYLPIVGRIYLLLYVYTGAIRGTKPCPLEVVYMCLQQSSKSAIVA